MITGSEIDDICQLAESAVLGEAFLDTLRKKYPDHHFTWCMDDDIGEGVPPFREAQGFNIYLVNSSDHCSKLSNDAESSSGVVIAEVFDDDD